MKKHRHSRVRTTPDQKQSWPYTFHPLSSERHCYVIDCEECGPARWTVRGKKCIYFDGEQFAWCIVSASKVREVVTALNERTVALGTVNAGATGTAIGVQDLQNSYVQLTGTFSATWYIDVSMNGTNYAVFDSGSAAKLVGPIPVAGTVRLRVGAGTGSVVGVLGGDDAAAGSVKITPLGSIDDGNTGDDYAVDDLAGCYVVVSGTFTGTITWC